MTENPFLTPSEMQDNDDDAKTFNAAEMAGHLAIFKAVGLTEPHETAYGTATAAVVDIVDVDDPEQSGRYNVYQSYLKRVFMKSQGLQILGKVHKGDRAWLLENLAEDEESVARALAVR